MTRTEEKATEEGNKEIRPQLVSGTNYQARLIFFNVKTATARH